MNPIKVSVIISNYNNGWRLRKCIESVMNQSLKEIEIIVVDDASTDNSIQILNEMKQVDKRVRLISKNVNQGTHMTRVSGVAAARGKYIMFLDGDDYYTREACETAYNAIDNKYDMVVFNINVINVGCLDQDLLNWNMNFYNKLKSGEYDKEKMMNLPYMDTGMPSFMWNKIFKSSIIKSAFGEVELGYYNLFEDMYELLVVLSKCRIIKKIDNALICYTYGSGISTYDKRDYAPGDIIRNSSILSPFCGFCDKLNLIAHKNYFIQFILKIMLGYGRSINSNLVDGFLEELFKVFGVKYIILFLVKDYIYNGAGDLLKRLLAFRKSFTYAGEQRLLMDNLNISLQPLILQERYTNIEHLIAEKVGRGNERLSAPIPCSTMPKSAYDPNTNDPKLLLTLLANHLADLLNLRINCIYVNNKYIPYLEYYLVMYRLLGIHTTLVVTKAEIIDIIENKNNTIMQSLDNGMFDCVYVIDENLRESNLYIYTIIDGNICNQIKRNIKDYPQHSLSNLIKSIG